MSECFLLHSLLVLRRCEKAYVVKSRYDFTAHFKNGSVYLQVVQSSNLNEARDSFGHSNVWYSNFILVQYWPDHWRLGNLSQSAAVVSFLAFLHSVKSCFYFFVFFKKQFVFVSLHSRFRAERILSSGQNRTNFAPVCWFTFSVL